MQRRGVSWRFEERIFRDHELVPEFLEREARRRGLVDVRKVETKSDLVPLGEPLSLRGGRLSEIGDVSDYLLVIRVVL